MRSAVSLRLARLSIMPKQRLAQTSPSSAKAFEHSTIIRGTLYQFRAFGDETGFKNKENIKPDRRERSPIGGIGGVDLLGEDDSSSNHRRKNVIEGYSDDSEYYLIDGENGEEVTLKGSSIILPYSYFSWKVRSIHEIIPITGDEKQNAKARLAFQGLLNLVDPPIETIIFGTKTDDSMDHLAFGEMQKLYRKKHGVSIEQMSLGHACATFNILNAEDRRVMVALIG